MALLAQLFVLKKNNNCYITGLGAKQFMIMNVMIIEGLIIKIRDMKTQEKMNYGFERDQLFKNDYAFSSDDFRIHQIQNQNFIVPWQIIEKEKRQVLTD